MPINFKAVINQVIAKLCSHFTNYVFNFTIFKLNHFTRFSINQVVMVININVIAREALIKVMTNDQIKFIECPFTGECLAAIPSIRPDVAVIHAQRADRKGNVLIEGIVGIQKEVVLAARRSIVTIEEIVDDLGASVNACVLPSWAITAIAEAPQGAKPSYALGYYDRDNAFYKDWDGIARDRETFQAWLKENVFEKGAA